MSTSAPADVAEPLGSTSTVVARVKATGHHVLKIDGYSQTTAMVATGDHIRSCDFHVGGHTWRIKYYPNGEREEYADSISVMLELDGAGKVGSAVVKAQLRCTLLDHAGEPVPSHSFAGQIRSFPSPEGCTSSGFLRFIKREDLEKSEHLKMYNCFAIRCDVNVIGDLDLVVEETFLNVPKSDLHTHLGHLLSTKEGTDVVFKVGEETFDAHRCVLAARSPVFKAELFGFMEPAGRSVTIDNMDAPAFEALLHFIYTDTLPEMAVQDVPAVTRQLLAAADKYQVERLKLVCEDRLSRHVDADDQRQHHHRLPWFIGTCLEFLSCIFSPLGGFAMSTSAPPNVNKAGDAPPCPSSSTIVVSKESGYHVLKVEGYSRTKMMIATGDHVNSGEFHVGGHSWRINYYPSGNRSESADSISLFLEMTSAAAAIDDVHAGLKFSLIDHAGEPVQSCRYVGKCTFTKKQNRSGSASFIKREDLEKSEHLKDDCFAVRCDLTVIIKELRVGVVVKVPPPVLQRNLGELLSGKDRTDVTFKVGKETFVAHRCILAARSSVFKAELFGSMKECTTRCIDVEDMEADVFRALLQFIYTDELPEMNKEDVAVMAQHLLVAADRYNMERLKMICEDMLYRHLEVSTAATTLALAEQHHCPRLKEAIFGFLNSPAKLRAVVKSDGYEHLTTSCPSITTELVAKIAALWN